MTNAKPTFQEILGYLEWENAGILNAANAGVPSDLSEKDLNRAYDLGRNLK